MPNHCETDLYIRGPKEKVEEFAKWLEEIEPLQRDICRALIPYPEHFVQRDKDAEAFSFFNRPEGVTDEQVEAAKAAFIAKYGDTKDGYNAGGYEWCCKNWGTKWGIYETDYTPDAARRGALFSFQSAWAPPSEEVFRALSAKFPDLTFEAEWFERGAAYCGGLTFYSKAESEDFGLAFGEVQHSWSGAYNGSRGG